MKRIGLAANLAFGVMACLPLWAQSVAELEEQTIRSAVERVAPSVVRIDTIGGLESGGEVSPGDGPTTGLIVASDGFILSSSFNFVRQPSSILVTLGSGERLPATMAAQDHSRKLVLLRVQSDKPLPTPEAVPAEEIVVGQTAVAVGRTFTAAAPNVSVGIISARNRIWGKAIQSDAKISPANYGGPLIDLHGRVFGVLAPLSPDSQNELAGAEWYDGGIGFAVPLVDILPRLDRLKRGEDLHPGLLGVTLKSGDMYSQPAEIAACHRKSPSYQAGLRAGDTIVAVNGEPIERQVQLKHALGPRIAGDTIKIVAQRGGDRQELSVTLAERIDPYAHPFLGILPARGGAEGETGVEVRYVFPDSAAFTAELRPGDRILKLDDRRIANAGELREALAGFEPKNKAALVVSREGREMSKEIVFSALPEQFPAEASVKVENAGEQPAAPVEVKIPEEPNACVAYVPKSYRGDTASALLLVLPQPGEFKPADFVSRWSSWSEKYGMIVVAPQAQLPNTWVPTETVFIRKVVDHFVASYNVDRTRIVFYGFQSSGSMAFLAAFRLRDVVRGVVAVEAAIPGLARPAENDPIERLAVVSVVAEESRMRSRIEKTAEVLREMKYPVILEIQPGESREPPGALVESILRWIETLDRI